MPVTAEMFSLAAQRTAHSTGARRLSALVHSSGAEQMLFVGCLGQSAVGTVAFRLFHSDSVATTASAMSGTAGTLLTAHTGLTASGGAYAIILDQPKKYVAVRSSSTSGSTSFTLYKVNAGHRIPAASTGFTAIKYEPPAS